MLVEGVRSFAVPCRGGVSGADVLVARSHGNGWKPSACRAFSIDRQNGSKSRDHAAPVAKAMLPCSLAWYFRVVKRVIRRNNNQYTTSPWCVFVCFSVLSLSLHPSIHPPPKQSHKCHSIRPSYQPSEATYSGAIYEPYYVDDTLKRGIQNYIFDCKGLWNTAVQP